MTVGGFNIKATATGTAVALAPWLATSVTFADTPDNFLREVHVQFDTINSVRIEITLDGVNYMAINNGNTLLGLGTFTFFVVKGTVLNFRTASGSASTNFAIVVTGT